MRKKHWNLLRRPLKIICNLLPLTHSAMHFASLLLNWLRTINDWFDYIFPSTNHLSGKDHNNDFQMLLIIPANSQLVEFVAWVWQVPVRAKRWPAAPFGWSWAAETPGNRSWWCNPPLFLVHLRTSVLMADISVKTLQILFYLFQCYKLIWEYGKGSTEYALLNTVVHGDNIKIPKV